MHLLRIISLGALLLSILAIHDVPVCAQETAYRTTDDQDIVRILNDHPKLPNCIVTCTKAGKVVARVSFTADNAVDMKVESQTVMPDSARNALHLQGKAVLRLFRDKKQIMELSADEMSIAVVKSSK